jgi:hypothetical protein
MTPLDAAVETRRRDVWPSTPKSRVRGTYYVIALRMNAIGVAFMFAPDDRDSRATWQH